MTTRHSDTRLWIGILVLVMLRLLQITALVVAAYFFFSIVGGAFLEGSPVTKGSLIALATAVFAASALQFGCIALENPDN